MPLAEHQSNAEISPCLAVVMPVFNEGGTVGEVLKKVLEQKPIQEVIVVDDASADNTWEALQQISKSDSRVRIFRHEKNKGKGAALQTGFAQVSAPIVI